MADRKIEPLFWINPNFRLQFPYFSIKWYLIDHQVLVQEAMQGGRGKMVYQTQKNLMMMMLRDNHSGLDLLYSENTQFENLRLQSWLRINIRDQIVISICTIEELTSASIWRTFLVSLRRQFYIN